MIMFNGRDLIKKQGIYLLTFISVFTGGMIYVLWRQDTVRFFGWLDAIGLYPPVETIRSYSLPLYPLIPNWIVYSLPNGLWAFGYALVIVYLWRGNSSNIKYFWYATIPVLAIGWEMSQYFGLITGIFCYNDLFLSSAGIGFGAILGLKYNREVTK